MEQTYGRCDAIRMQEASGGISGRESHMREEPIGSQRPPHLRPRSPTPTPDCVRLTAARESRNLVPGRIRRVVGREEAAAASCSDSSAFALPKTQSAFYWHTTALFLVVVVVVVVVHSEEELLTASDQPPNRKWTVQCL